MRKMLKRLWPVGVIQMCWIAPGPVISQRVNVWPGSMRTDGETFQPWPRSWAAPSPVPCVAMPALPFSPVKFSGEMERDSESLSWWRFSMELKRWFAMVGDDNGGARAVNNPTSSSDQSGESEKDFISH